MTAKYRMKARVDNNQGKIVKELLQIPGVSVELGHDDIICGYRKRTFWFEIKSEAAVSRKTGKVLESRIEDDQKRLRSTFTGQYDIVKSTDEILAIIFDPKNHGR